MSEYAIGDLEAVILVGGKGSRLQSVVSDRPKPMAEVAGRPFVEWLVLALRDQGIRRVVFCTGYMGEVVAQYFGDGRCWDMTFVYAPEPEPLGTAGALRFALDQVQGERFLALNGDSYCQADVSTMCRCHKERGSRATLWLVLVGASGRYGSVVLGKDNEILGFQEKSADETPGLINAGVYLLEREAIFQIPESQPVSIETQVFPQLVGQGIYGVTGEGPFLDIGTPESFVRAESFCRDHLARFLSIS